MAKQFEYAVRVPIVGFIDVTVFSNEELSDDDALDLAYDTDGISQPEKHADNWEYEAVRQIVQGNFFYGSCNEFSVELVDTHEDDD